MSDLIERLKLARRMVAGQHDMATIDEAITALSPTLPDEDYQAVKQKASELQEELNAEIKISNERWDRIEQLEAESGRRMNIITAQQKEIGRLTDAIRTTDNVHALRNLLVREVNDE